MLSCSANDWSLVGAAWGRNPPAVLSAIEQTLYWANGALMTVGVLLAAVVLVYWWMQAPVAISPEPMADDADRVPPEVVFLPVLAYLTVMLVTYPVFAQFVGTVGTGGDDELDLAALLANNLAFVGGGAACYVAGRRFVSRGGAPFVTGGKPALPQIAGGLMGGVIAIALCQLTLQLTVYLVYWVWPDYVFPEHGVIDALRNPACPSWLPVVLWIGVVAATPVAEELFFRGILQTAFVRATRSRWWSVLLAGLLFGMAHASQPQVVPALTVFGIILGIMYLRSGSLVGPIVAHAVFNGKTLIWETLMLTQ